MHFQVGDKVVHPIHGVGTVKEFSKQLLTGEQAHEYYQVITMNATLWVPINDAGAVELRKVAPRESLGECRKLLRGHAIPFGQNRQMRQLEITKRLKGNLLPELCEMVRDLRARGKQKPLGLTEDKVLRKAYKALCDEWAAVDDVTVQKAVFEIESLLREAT
jgi:CarD family transcriptional regulator